MTSSIATPWQWLLGTGCWAYISIETIAMETVSKVIRILAHSNQSLATVTMTNHLGHRFPWWNSKSVRHLDQCQLSDLETLRPLVAPSLQSGRYSLGPLGF